MESLPRGRPAVAPRFLDAHRWVLDAALAVVLGIIGVASFPGASFETPAQTVYVLIVAGCCAAVAVRRLWPVVSLSVLAMFLLVHLVVVPQAGLFALLMCLLAAYTAQTHTAPPARWIFTALVLAGAVSGMHVASAPRVDDWRAWSIGVVAVLAQLVVAGLIGVVRRQARARYEAAIERAAVLEAQQEVERRLAAADERATIAREMHDILGHSLNAIAMQAEGTRHVLRADPDRADAALAGIGRLSRGAVDEVRGLIDVLRTEDGAALRRPAPLLTDLPALIGTFRGSNERIRLQASGDLGEVPAHVARAGYRIVQEALTNAAKHAPGAPVTVRVAVMDGAVDLMIANPATRPAAPPARRGHGLVGMGERARCLGGTIHAGPDPTAGGWTVAATLPWSRP
ncbi:MAG: histidine kinase [Propioniciclava sp.]|uniref:sensor histidine kinase n=1 Tax=Propioniciclava sp. TaxID=2038686 RepID=UPI0039E50CCD